MSSLRHVCRMGLGMLEVHAPVRIDLGGIAKGFAVDRAAEVLCAAGVPSGVVNAGGDLRVFGDLEEAIYLRRPDAPDQLHFAGQLRDGACATSATYFSRKKHEGAEVSALVNPRSGDTVRTRCSFTVLAPTCAVADALTKVLALSVNASHPCLARFNAHPIILYPREEAA